MLVALNWASYQGNAAGEPKCGSGIRWWQWIRLAGQGPCGRRSCWLPLPVTSHHSLEALWQADLSELCCKQAELKSCSNIPVNLCISYRKMLQIAPCSSFLYAAVQTTLYPWLIFAKIRILSKDAVWVSTIWEGKHTNSVRKPLKKNTGFLYSWEQLNMPSFFQMKG